MVRILFVCLGNICRSPAAHGVALAMAAARGMDVEIDSAGTSDWHVGNPPYGPMISAAGARGYDLRPLRARQFRAADFAQFDMIIGMDHSNIQDIERLRPATSTTPVTLFLDEAPELGVNEVPDPYYTGDFDKALDLVEQASRGLLRRLEHG